MKTITHSSFKKRRIRIQVSFGLALFLLCLQPVRHATLGAPVAYRPIQSKVTVVAILPFQDETDTGAPPELGKKIALQLKQRLSLGFADVLPKSLSQNSDAALTVEQVVALGKQNAVQFVVRGGVLALAGTESNLTAQLYAEVISVESGTVNVVRAEGTGAGGNIQWSKIDLNSASFSSSAPGIALAAAVDSLATSIHQSLLTPLAEVAEVSAAGSSESAETAEPTATVETAAADADEELQQLIAQAEEVVASGGGDAGRLQSVSSGLQKLKAALTSKASQIERGADSTSSDQEIAAARSEIQTALSALSEQASSADTSSAEAPPTGEKKSLLGVIDQRASEALGILQKIQEMRAALRGTKDESSSGYSASEGSPAESSEQPTEDVSGVVMQEGEPLAGVEVAVQNSDVTAMTGPDGSYTLKALPAGKLSNLVLKKNGKQLAVGKVDLLRGRQAVADFDLKLNKAPAASALRIIPSTIVLKRNAKAGPTGTLKGIARDQAGKPLPRALVSLNGPAAGKERVDRSAPVAKLHAVARTDSQGRYVFVNVPAGEHLVTVQRSGSRPLSTRVLVKANAATESQSQLATIPRPARERQRSNAQGASTRPSPASGGVNPIVISRDRALGNNQASPQRDPERLAGTTTRPSPPRAGALRGQVIDASNRRPIAGAHVSIAGRRVNTDQSGNYEFADLAPGNYVARVTSSGFSEDQKSIAIRAGAASREEFALRRLGDANRTVRAVPEPSRVPTQNRFGQVRGRVVDAASGIPIAGAIVAVSGRPTVVSGRDGSYSLSALPPGSYQVSISRPGFAEKRTAFTIRAGDVTEASFRLTAMVRRPSR
jgi:Carboxypeptidase regulatory-like domain